ncbi:hypothetical protein MLD38_014556 [Melastoma candidum]|uniref:Uncharacterized protein n=1 Tax=Melastoma candidum TaxID=119954 RepID=A0ACB9RCS4_9MYRT|nr:hypothetical protein MLD38_014556 [Melastoma candidum]
MLAESGKPSLKFIFQIKKKGEDPQASNIENNTDDNAPETIQVSSPQKERNGLYEKVDEGDISDNENSKQLVVYDPDLNLHEGSEPDPDPTIPHPPAFLRCFDPDQPPRVLPSIGAFTVQCAGCFKWRLIPTKEKYEEIREHILEDPFYCETAREWRPDISCDEPEDISQDGSRLWAIDKPNIAQPPLGWQRLLRIRGEGGSKFADVYYVAPSGKRLRSMVEIQKYLEKHPEFVTDEMSLSQFSFQIPRPLHDNYVRKRPARAIGEEAKELTWTGPGDLTQLHLGPPGLLSPHAETSATDVTPPPSKKRTKKNPSRKLLGGDLNDNQPDVGLAKPYPYTINDSHR